MRVCCFCHAAGIRPSQSSLPSPRRHARSIFSDWRTSGMSLRPRRLQYSTTLWKHGLRPSPSLLAVMAKVFTYGLSGIEAVLARHEARRVCRWCRCGLAVFTRDAVRKRETRHGGAAGSASDSISVSYAYQVEVPSDVLLVQSFPLIYVPLISFHCSLL